MRYVCLFAGPTRESARLICTTMDGRAVHVVAKAALRNLPQSKDPVLRHLSDGRRKALEAITEGEK